MKIEQKQKIEKRKLDDENVPQPYPRLEIFVNKGPEPSGHQQMPLVFPCR